MKKLLLLMLTMVSLNAKGQDENPQPYLKSTRDFSKWTIGVLGTANYPNTDVEYTTIGGNNYSYFMNLRYSLTHALGVEARYGFGNVHGEESKLDFNTAINSELSGNLVIGLGGISYLRNFQSFRMYLIAGGGQIKYSPVSKNKMTGETSIDTTITNTFVSAGVGLTYRLGNRTNLTGEVSLMQIPGDDFDGRKVPYSNDDFVSRVSIGLSYNLNKKKQHIEWYNPIADMTQSSRVDSITITVKNNLGNKAMLDSLVKADSILKANSVSKAALHSLYIGSVYFYTDQYDIDPNFLEMLAKIQKLVKTNSNLNIRIVGFTDETGAQEHNIILSRDRAQSVADYIIGSTGISPDRVEIDYKGVAPETFSDVTNRRADIYLDTK